jgi:hypothetical protein
MEKENSHFHRPNHILRASGIGFELFDVRRGSRVTSAVSKDLNPPHNGRGVKLIFSTSSPGPFEVYTNDPTYKYPGKSLKVWKRLTRTASISICRQCPPTRAARGRPRPRPA